jgi:hypothetical protein
LENNHPFLDASCSLLRNEGEEQSQHHPKEHAQKQKQLPKWRKML